MEPGKFEVQEDSLPEPGPDEVRIRVRAAGICGTDLEVYRGHVPAGWVVEFPFQMGHELSGVVDAVGDNVPNAKVGDRVVPDGRVPCGYCSFCRKGQVNACENAGYNAGGFREYSVYNYKAVVPVPDNVSFEEAAMAEPISCTMYGNEKLDVGIGDFAVVIGEGAIGQLHAQLLKSRGARVAMVGLIEDRLKVGKKLGVDHVIDANKADPVAEINELTGGYGADVVVVAAGVEAVLRQALEMAGRYGQVLYFAANMKEMNSMPMDLIHYKELKVIGSYDSTTSHFEKALRALSVGKVDAKSLISHMFSLDETEKAFSYANEGKGMKIMITNKEK
jgi:L-iditol 2-dehydrogenase